jgi:flavin reductase (DIM6/NTAB) family NADH-FMN oxidoreductase RutF
MEIIPDGIEAPELYKLLTGIVVPRPIAWVSTLGPNGIVNLAPFSCFTFVSAKPPMVGINVGLRDGQRKDTSLNIAAHKEFVVNIGDETMIEAIHKSAIDYPPDVSEVELLGFSVKPSHRIKTPYLAEAPISLECRFVRSIEFGETGAEFIVGEVVVFHVRDGLCEANKIDTKRLRPICRIGGPNYAMLGEIVSMSHVGEVRTGPGRARV